MLRRIPKEKGKFLIKMFIVLQLLTVCLFSRAQAQTTSATDTVPTMDLPDLFRKILKKTPDSTKPAKPPRFALLPTLSYNPSMGFVIGGKVSAGLQRGDPANTNYSIIGIEAVLSSKGIITLQARHNIFTAFNKWNFQGNWQLSRYGMVDYGLGTGTKNYRSDGFIINEFPSLNGDSSFPIKYNFLRLTERVYRKIGPHLYVGAGISFNRFWKIVDEKAVDSSTTPHELYSLKHEFNPEKYSANGFMINLQYITREHPTRSYGGVYADVGFRFNQKWLGSSENAIELQWEFRKYWSLSKKIPQHVIAFWHWARLQLSGEIPYLALPYTAADTYNRGGRGYTLGRFKGPNYAYFETEYRFPITRNKLLSGVCFLNLQTASNDLNRKVFQYWEPGGGAGLRVLFQKQSRTTVCIDFAKGRYGSSGIFFGLNEAF